MLNTFKDSKKGYNPPNTKQLTQTASTDSSIVVYIINNFFLGGGIASINEIMHSGTRTKNPERI